MPSRSEQGTAEKNVNCLRWTVIHFAVYLTFGLLSGMSFLLYRSTLGELWFRLGLILMYGWACNPLPLFFDAIGLGRYLRTRNDEGVKPLVGRRWRIYPVVMVGSVLLYGVFIVIMVTCTGGV